MTESLQALFERDLNQLIKEIEQTPEHNLWRTQEGIINPIGTLVLHLCGNLNHFIGAVLGNTGYIRERDKEFSLRDIAKNELIKNVEETREAIITTLKGLTSQDLQATYPISLWNKEFTTEYFLIHLVHHLGYHTGQANYLRRILTDN